MVCRFDVRCISYMYVSKIRDFLQGKSSKLKKLAELMAEEENEEDNEEETEEEVL